MRPKASAFRLKNRFGWVELQGDCGDDDDVDDDDGDDGADPKFGHTPFKNENFPSENQRLGASFETSWGSFLHNNLFTPNNWKVDVPHKKKKLG